MSSLDRDGLHASRRAFARLASGGMVGALAGDAVGLKRFVSIRESPYHGLNFCQGTVSEMLQDPGREIFDVIRYFGYDGMMMPDHVPTIPGDDGLRQAFAYTFGYIKALIRAVDAESA